MMCEGCARVPESLRMMCNLQLELLLVMLSSKNLEMSNW
jgi:hypothetical protein